MVDSIKSVIMKRDGLTEEEADELIEEAQYQIESILDEGGNLLEAEQVIEDIFGLEPDYLDELLPF